MRPVGFANVQLPDQRHGPHAVLPGPGLATVVSDAVRREPDANRFQLLQVNTTDRPDRIGPDRTDWPETTIRENTHVCS